MIGTQIGGYRVVDELGEGALGEVVVGRHDLLQREVVIELVRPRAAADRDQVRRGLDVARAANRLHHAGIVKVHDVGFLPTGHAFVATERLRGPTLAARLEAGPLTVAQATALARQLASAIGAAHDAGIVHGDLAPERMVLVADPGAPDPILAGGERIKIAGFGLATLARGAAGEPDRAGDRHRLRGIVQAALGAPIPAAIDAILTGHDGAAAPGVPDDDRRAASAAPRRGRAALSIAVVGALGVGLAGLIVASTLGGGDTAEGPAPEPQPAGEAPAPTPPAIADEPATRVDLFVTPSEGAGWSLDDVRQDIALPARLSGLAPGRYRLTIHAPAGYLDAHTVIALEPGEHERVDLVLIEADDASSAPRPAIDEPAPPKRTAAGGACLDEIECLLADDPPACCERYQTRSRRPRPRPDVPESLTAAMVKEVMSGLRPAIRRCGDDAPDARGTVGVKVRVAPTGAVAAVTVTQTPDDELGRCVAGVVRPAVFPRTAGGATFNYPIRF
jgi:tRNA A-37 threonylcarbamoyl transferase component Bud32